MTLTELNGLYYLDREIKRIQERINRLSREIDMSGGLSGVSYDGVSGGQPATTSATERVVEKKMELLEYLNELQEEKATESLKIHKFIYSCGDKRLQHIMSMRFIDKKSWNYIYATAGVQRQNALVEIKKYLAAV